MGLTEKKVLKCFSGLSENLLFLNRGRGRNLMSEVELLGRGLLYVGERNVVRESERFKIYLPKGLNKLWEELAKGNRRVEIYIKVASTSREA
jgi:hypothetical protein